MSWVRLYSGPGPPHYREFTITPRHKTLGRTPLGEWSARCGDRYLITHNTPKRPASMPPGGIRTHSTRKRAAPDPCLREKSERTDEDKTFVLSLVPGFNKNWNMIRSTEQRWKCWALWDKQKKYGVSVTICAVFYRNDFFIKDIRL